MENLERNINANTKDNTYFSKTYNTYTMITFHIKNLSNIEIEALSDNDYAFWDRLESCQNFMIRGDAMGDIEKLCGKFEVNLVRGKIKDASDLMYSGRGTFQLVLPWITATELEPEKSHLIVLDIDQADSGVISKLSSILKNVPDNARICLLDISGEKTIPITIEDLVKPIIFWK